MEETNEHHIFTNPEIRTNLIKILGEPKTEIEKKHLEAEVKFVWNRIPRYKLDKEKHRMIHMNSANKRKFVPKKLIKLREEVHSPLN